MKKMEKSITSQQKYQKIHRKRIARVRHVVQTSDEARGGWQL